jgi:hypothetical protein
MRRDRDFLRQVAIMAALDKFFQWFTPAFCALVIVGALASILWRISP